MFAHNTVAKDLRSEVFNPLEEQVLKILYGDVHFTSDELESIRHNVNKIPSSYDKLMFKQRAWEEIAFRQYLNDFNYNLV